MPASRAAPLLLITLYVFAACDRAAGPPGFVVRDSAGIAIADNLATPAACMVREVPELDIGTAAGAPEYELYRVSDGVRLSDGRVVIINRGSDEVRVFGADGRFINTFGRAGGGPGEFRQVFLVHAVADTLYVIDFRPWRYTVFTAAGEYIRTIDTQPSYINTPRQLGMLADGRFVLGLETADGLDSGFVDSWLQIITHDPTGLLEDTVDVRPFGRIGTLDAELRFMGGPLFEPGARFDAAGDRIVVGDAVAREIEVHDSDYQLVRLIRWNGDDLAVTDEDVAAFRAEQLRDVADNAEARRFVDPLVSPDRPVSRTFPAFASLQIADSGEIWVHEYPRPRMEGPAPWLVFTADGRLLCSASLPAGFSLFRAGSDWILGARTDEMDVEHVALYRFDRP